MVEAVNGSQNEEISRWGGSLKEYCLKYEDRLRVVNEYYIYIEVIGGSKS